MEPEPRGEDALAVLAARVGGEGDGRHIPRARRGAAAAVELDDVLDDGQSEAEAAVRARRAAVALAETLEDQRKELAGDALAGVGDGDAHGVALRLIGADRDRAARRRELHRVRKEIPDHLLQALGVAGGDAVDAPELEVQRDPFRGDAW